MPDETQNLEKTVAKLAEFVLVALQDHALTCSCGLCTLAEEIIDFKQRGQNAEG